MTVQLFTARLMTLALLALACTGCINLGKSISVEGEIVDTTGQRIADAEVTAQAELLGGRLYTPSDSTDPDPEIDNREVQVTHHGDGTFTATARWASSVTLSVTGYKIRREDDLDTVFNIPNVTFYDSTDDVKLEVVPDDSAN